LTLREIFRRLPKPSSDLFRLQSNTQRMVRRSHTTVHTRHSWICCQRGWRRVQYTTNNMDVPPRDLMASLSHPTKKRRKKSEKCPNDGVKFLFFSLLSRLVAFLLPFSRRSMASWE
jgi:hypothetical protein